MKLVSVNIERSKHLDRVIPFLQGERAGVVCMQELAEEDIPRLADALGMTCVYAPSNMYIGEPGVESPRLVGIGIFAPAFENVRHDYYRGSEAAARASEPVRIFANNAVLSCRVNNLAIATTHFPWTPDGQSDESQRTALPKMLAITEALGEMVLFGDFNAPRGGEIFELLSTRYKDNIPTEYKTSIDVNLHRSGHLASEDMDKKMVDGLFTTPSYVASNVHLVDGVSDHMAIVANIERA